MTPAVPAHLVDRAVALASGRRGVLGIVGAPGAGKSTLAAALVAALSVPAVVVGMDGFHLADDELARLGRTDRKGAVDTIDGYGYLALLRRLRDQGPETVYAPLFDRTIEAAIAGAVAVARDVALVVTEGNWLLDAAPPWPQVREMLDEVWFCESPEDRRLDRLVARHVAHGRSPQDARRWANGPDQRNAERIAAVRADADLVVRVE